MGVDTSEMPSDYTLAPVKIKACLGCALRRGSPERADLYGFLSCIERWFDKNNPAPHYCHESVPGHPEEVKDGSPRWMQCCSVERIRSKLGNRAVSLLIDAALSKTNFECDWEKKLMHEEGK